MKARLLRLAGACQRLYPIAAVALGSWLVTRALPAALAQMRKRPWDGEVGWLGGQYFLAGKNPFPSGEFLKDHGITEFGFPPTAPIWFVPLARLELYEMSLVLGSLCMLVLLLHLALTSSELGLRNPLATAWLLFGMVISTSFFRYHLFVAQVSEVIAIFCVLGWWFLRRGEDGRAGVMIGMAASWKPFPALLVAVLLVERRVRLAIFAGATYLAFVALATWRFGFACWGQFAAGQKPVMDYWMSSVQNSSLHGIILRLFHPVCGPRGPQEPLSTAIASLLSLALIAAFWWLGRPLVRANKLDLPIASLLALAPFVNPVMWEHYDVLLLLPLVIAAVALWRAEGLSPSAAVLGWAAVAAVALLIGQEIGIKGGLAEQLAKNPSLHVKLHVYEVANWLHTPILLALLAALQIFYTRRPEAEPCPR